jgi:hypothetical protein
VMRRPRPGIRVLQHYLLPKPTFDLDVSTTQRTTGDKKMEIIA